MDRSFQDTTTEPLSHHTIFALFVAMINCKLSHEPTKKLSEKLDEANLDATPKRTNLFEGTGFERTVPGAHESEPASLPKKKTLAISYRAQEELKLLYDEREADYDPFEYGSDGESESDLDEEGQESEGCVDEDYYNDDSNFGEPIDMKIRWGRYYAEDLLAACEFYREQYRHREIPVQDNGTSLG